MKWVVSLWKYCPTSTTIITLKGTICYFSDTNYVKDNDIYCSYISTQVMGIWPKWKHITLNLTAAEYVWQNKNPGKMLLVSTLTFVVDQGGKIALQGKGIQVCLSFSMLLIVIIIFKR